jgi:hypothetical protein
MTLINSVLSAQHNVVDEYGENVISQPMLSGTAKVVQMHAVDEGL